MVASGPNLDLLGQREVAATPVGSEFRPGLRERLADGATTGEAGLRAAIFDYNHADWYVREVLSLACSHLPLL